MKIRFLGSIFFNKEKAELLKKLIIIKENLIDIQGFPKSLANIGTLKLKNILCNMKGNRYNIIY